MNKSSRRNFLKGAAVAAGAFAMPTIIPASALGRGGAVAPSARIVMGAIGIGGRGYGDLSWMLTQPDLHFTAVCDVQRSNRERAKNKVNEVNANKDCAAFIDFRQMLAERTDIDAVLIATGDRWHGPMSVAAMKAGKDVYCEKPSCLTIAEGLAIVDTARRYGRIFQTGVQRLSEPHHVYAMEMARLGRLGKLHTLYADVRWRDGSRIDSLPEQPQPSKDELDWEIWLGHCPWRPYNEGYLKGGWYHFRDFATDNAMWGAHTIAQCLAGIDITKLGIVEINYDPKSPIQNVQLLKDLKMVMHRGMGEDVHGPCAYWHGYCGERFDGTEGWAAAADGYSRTEVSSPALLADYKKILGEYRARTGRPFNHVRDFLDCVRTRRQPVANHDVMCMSMSISLAADISTFLQRSLKLDLIKGEILDDPEANRFRYRSAREPWPA